MLQELDEGKDPEAIEPYNESLPKPVQRVHHEGDAEDPMAGLGEAAAAAELPPIPPPPGPGRRPTSRRGPGGPRAGRGAPPRTPQRPPKKHTKKHK